jgi:hypothetical protein
MMPLAFKVLARYRDRFYVGNMCNDKRLSPEIVDAVRIADFAQYVPRNIS